MWTVQEQLEYMECLKTKNNMAEECTGLAKSYLMCRMDAYVSKHRCQFAFTWVFVVLVYILCCVQRAYGKAIATRARSGWYLSTRES